jgi:Single-strand binding protein family
MTVAVLISGSIFRAPEQRTSQAGRRFVSATLKVGENRDVEFWSVLAFSTSAGDELMRLGLNERAAIQGGLRLEIFTKDGEPRISRTVFADHVLALRAPPREKKPAAAKAAPSQETNHTTTTSGPPFDDDIPFLLEWR